MWLEVIHIVVHTEAVTICCRFQSMNVLMLCQKQSQASTPVQ
jgi:hypothetical protein